MALKTPWPICATCQAIPLAFFQTKTATHNLNPYKLWPSFYAFADSASRGCHTCTLLHEAVREPFKHRLDTEPVHLEHATPNVNDPPALALTVDLASSPNRDRWDESLWKHHDSSKQPTFQFVPIADIKHVSDPKDIPQGARHFKDFLSLYAENDGALKYIKQNLTRCLANHTVCNRFRFPLSTSSIKHGNVTEVVYGSRGFVVAPTRLVYVGSDDGKIPPKLVDGEDCLNNGGHLILSYCWGMTPKHAPWKLTKTTMEQFSTEIPLNVLPQTLYDAIEWTRKLGESYIWIDSMCILQDSEEDWEREAARMSAVYGSATMTLAAASGSVYGGMSDHRNPLRHSASALSLCDGLSEATVYLLPNGQPRTSAVPPPPTEGRAWCYQEDLLSCRLIKMDRRAVEWQCLNDTISRALDVEHLQTHPRYRWYKIWYRLIERYSNKSLTYPKDRLVALHSIASAKAADTSVAGFLKTDPWISLLWCRDETAVTRHPGNRYQEYVAPTWSWASLDAPVFFYEASGRNARKSELDPLATDPYLHLVDVQPASSVDIGGLRGGSIEISCQIVIACTASVEPFLFNTGHGNHTYGRRNFVDLVTGEALGLVIFDLATEARDDMVLAFALLQTVDLGHWEQNRTAGLGLALSVQEATPVYLTCTRVGYVQFTSAFGAQCYRRRIRVL